VEEPAAGGWCQVRDPCDIAQRDRLGVVRVQVAADAVEAPAAGLVVSRLISAACQWPGLQAGQPEQDVEQVDGTFRSGACGEAGQHLADPGAFVCWTREPACGAGQEFADWGEVGAGEQRRAEEVRAELDDYRLGVGGLSFGGVGVREVRCREDQISRPVLLHRVADKAAAGAVRDEGELTLRVIVPVEVESVCPPDMAAPGHLGWRLDLLKDRFHLRGSVLKLPRYGRERLRPVNLVPVVANVGVARGSRPG
jgi:hypothetical protein